MQGWCDASVSIRKWIGAGKLESNGWGMGRIMFMSFL